MPEIAEVRLIADTMARFLIGKRLLQLRIRDPVKLAKWVNRCCPNLAAFNTKLDACKGIIVKGVQTRGKFSWLECEEGIYIGIHFGMSGNIRPEPTPEFLSTYKWRGKPITRDEFLKHCLVAFEYAGEKIDGHTANLEKIYFHDIRRFGRFDVFWNKAELDQKLKKLGHDPLSQDRLSDDEVIKLFKLHNNKNICKALMCQELFAGVGNYMKSETLYEAGICPYANVSQIPDSILLKLYQAIRDISQSAYRAGGATLYTYTGIQGDQTEFKGTLKIYGKDGEQDPMGFTIQRIADNQSPDRRTTFWVPEIQTIGLAGSAATGAHEPNQIVPKKMANIKLLKPIHPLPKLRSRDPFKTHNDGTRTMPDGYRAGNPGYRDCCGSSLCSLGSECNASIERLVECGIIQKV